MPRSAAGRLPDKTIGLIPAFTPVGGSGRLTGSGGSARLAVMNARVGILESGNDRFVACIKDKLVLVDIDQQQHMFTDITAYFNIDGMRYMVWVVPMNDDQCMVGDGREVFVQFMDNFEYLVDYWEPVVERFIDKFRLEDVIVIGYVDPRGGLVGVDGDVVEKN